MNYDCLMRQNKRAYREIEESRAQPVEYFETNGQHPELYFKRLESAKKPNMQGEPQNKTASLKQQHGTTTLAFIYKGGIIVSVDSRSTMGSYISSGIVNKVIPITDSMLATIAGGAADCEYWERNLSVQCKKYEIEHGRRIGISAASKLFQTYLY